MYIYPRLRDFREDRDLSQKEIAALIGTTQQYYSEYERGIREIPLHIFIQLARFYNVSLDRLAENCSPRKK
ncbi:MAG: helix-turn-helix transcriptional regulator [Oscillospiraceae bacterium]|nr:helix-turn-helix transcriptional regulator [Oscillospiraceae bacterium]